MPWPPWRGEGKFPSLKKHIETSCEHATQTRSWAPICIFLTNLSPHNHTWYYSSPCESFPILHLGWHDLRQLAECDVKVTLSHLGHSLVKAWQCWLLPSWKPNIWGSCEKESRDQDWYSWPISNWQPAPTCQVCEQDHCGHSRCHTSWPNTTLGVIPVDQTPHRASQPLTQPRTVT